MLSYVLFWRLIFSSNTKILCRIWSWGGFHFAKYHLLSIINLPYKTHRPLLLPTTWQRLVPISFGWSNQTTLWSSGFVNTVALALIGWFGNAHIVSCIYADLAHSLLEGLWQASRPSQRIAFTRELGVPSVWFAVLFGHVPAVRGLTWRTRYEGQCNQMDVLFVFRRRTLIYAYSAKIQHSF
jgi:hypothetical protein